MDAVPFQSKEVGRFIDSWTTIQENASCLLCDVISAFHSRTKQAQTEREIALFFHRMPDSCIVFGCNNKSDSENGRAMQYPFLTIIARIAGKEGQKRLDFATLSVYTCLVGEGNPEMMSQSILDPFFFFVVHGPKSTQLPCFEKVYHLKEKSRAKSFSP